MVILLKFNDDRIYKNLLPDRVYPGIYDVDMAGLRSAGIKGLILDVDNTLKPPGPGGPDEKALDWIDAARESGFGICLLSNSLRGRVLKFSSGLGVYSVVGAKKPAAAGFIKAIRLLGLDASRICVIGDQIYTDVLGAKRLGLMAVYTLPMTKKEEFTVALKRILEYPILKRY